MKQAEIKTMVETIIKQSKSIFKDLDILDTEVRDTDNNPTSDVILNWARKAAGFGNNISKSLAKLHGIRKREELATYMKLKVASSVSNEKFVSTTSEKEAKSHVADLRVVENILESYYESAKTIISICRMHSNLKEEDKAIEANL